MTVDILGVAVDALTGDEAVERALSVMAGRRGAYVCTPNPEMLWLCHRDDKLRGIVNAAALTLPDGVGVLLGARMLGEPLPERVTGYDFACALMAKMRGSVFLLGAKPGVAERAADTIRSRWPNVTVAGTADGYFRDEDGIIARIEAARPELLLVCLGMGRQERLMARLAGNENIGLMAGLGGTLDVLAGDIPRAPEFFIRHHIEWLYRLWREPKRIKRVMRLPLYVAAVAGQRIKHGKTDRSGRH